LRTCFEPQNIEQGIMNDEINDKEQTLMISQKVGFNEFVI